MDALEGEWVRGATWYLEKAVEVVASSADPLSAAEKLRRVRPGMASLDFLYLVVKEAAARGVEAAEAARRVSTYVEEAKRRLDAVLAKVECPRRAVTISFSRAVTHLLESVEDTQRGCI
jgi:translation initiation factor eIF-2B subunit delta